MALLGIRETAPDFELAEAPGTNQTVTVECRLASMEPIPQETRTVCSESDSRRGPAFQVPAWTGREIVAYEPWATLYDEIHGTAPDVLTVRLDDELRATGAWGVKQVVAGFQFATVGLGIDVDTGSLTGVAGPNQRVHRPV